MVFVVREHTTTHELPKAMILGDASEAATMVAAGLPADCWDVTTIPPAAATEAFKTDCFDVVLMLPQVPQSDCFALARELRATDTRQANATVLAFGDRIDEHAAHGAGIDLVAPPLATPRELIVLISRAATRRVATSAGYQNQVEQNSGGVS